ncbi:transposase [Chryseobacterium angstadtii]|uniref:Transposase n=1 Tax=Chryseobacterium angstadtii TaxID=558151 RepID=A0A0J7L9M8_9FLAO|nr:hypothetical protein [Chryseobacterium angstadtii]KMQ65715.1 transposase [Chryseobacterium angstadtii]
MENLKKPDYKRIYTDLLSLKFPEKQNSCEHILSKTELMVKDVLLLNKIIFPQDDKKDFSLNQKHRSYDRISIMEILDYQKCHQLNNSQLANHFKISRNSVTKWKKHFQNN